MSPVLKILVAMLFILRLPAYRDCDLQNVGSTSTRFRNHKSNMVNRKEEASLPHILILGHILSEKFVSLCGFYIQLWK